MLAYTVVEALCRAKGAPEQNEDRLIIRPHVVAVVDGSTSSPPVDGVAGGVLAAEAVEEALNGLASAWIFRELVDQATAVLRGRLGHEPRPGSRRSASLLAWHPGRDELYRLGDSHALLDGRAFRNACLQARLRLGLTTVAEARRVSVLADVHGPLIAVQQAFQNCDTGHPLEYGVIDGTAVPDRFLEVHSTVGVRELVLCSDGFVYPPGTLEAGFRELERLREEDPLLTWSVPGSRAFPPQAQQFDDLTYVRLQVER
jgi:hypothetical protein